MLHKLMDMTGRVALVTGAAGKIGRVFCEALAELRCDVIALDRQQEGLDVLRSQLEDEFGAKIFTLCVDLEDEAARSSIKDSVLQLSGRLDVLVNNAAFVGDSQLTGWAVAFEDQELDTWRRAMEVNLTAVFHLCQSLAPVLKIGGVGSIVNIGSIYGIVGPDLRSYTGTTMGSPAAYAASKGGLIQLTRWLATVLAPHVRANSISPGGVARQQPTSFIKAYTSRTPQQRLATEEDLKGAMAYFATDLSSYVTGQNLMVDGGLTAW